MDIEYLKDKFAGCLLGLAIGDALGMPAKGMTPIQVMSKLHSPIDGYYASEGRVAGQYSSEAISAICVLKALALRKANPIDFEQLRIALEAEQFDLRANSTEFPAATAFSRIVPMAMFAAAKDMEPASIAKICKFLGKKDASKMDMLAMFIFAMMIKELIRNPDQLNTPSELYDADTSLLARMVQTARKSEDRFEHLDISNRLSEQLDFVRRKLMGKSCNPITMFGYFGNEGNINASLALNVFLYMNVPDDFNTICKAAALGGPAMINGAMVGALIGATIGSGLMPAEMKDNVQNGVKIESLAFKLAEVCIPQKEAMIQENEV